MAAPPIPPMRLGPIGIGPAVEELHRPASRVLAERYELTAFSDSQAANSTIDAPSGLAPDLVLTGGAIGTYLASHPGIPAPPESDDVRPAGTQGVLAGSSRQCRVPHSGSGTTTHPTLVRGSENRYRARPFADAVRSAPRQVGGATQSVADAMVVQRALDSAQRTAELALDPVSGTGPVPPRRPRGSTGLFDGLPGRISSSATFVA